MNIKRNSILVFVIFNLLHFSSISQYYHYADSKTHARGIAGFKNEIYMSTNSGLIYKYNIKNHKPICLNLSAPLNELRDIDVNGQKIIAMQSANSSQLAYVLNGKAIRIKIDANNVFFDGIAMYASKGMLFGDQIDGIIPVYYTESGGIKWFPVKAPIKALKGEYGFSASGSNMIYIDEAFIFVTGGLHSRFIKTEDMGLTWFTSTLPFESKESSGAYSVAMANKQEGVVVGGDYKKPDLASKNCFITSDGGKTWTAPKTSPNGYRSCVLFHDGVYYACGSNGIDYSKDNGLNWTQLSTGKFFTMTVLKNKLFVSASQGRVAEFKLVK
ncbi:MAG: hypothetical protein QNL43_03430 [Crocinitomicaceae bacterium]|tara:strand:- start:4090 stop:5073 length:984 start_codon:yes stop_codon:yes gene_type:complete